ncbi:NAD(P)H-dependent glycerol-3-phosphate dehydrogenase [Paenibacillus turpanensis]|uniref:NAD(P)H-dependent glycerol-3-phosphate dehydrogenase n=1 Tax=Paenibacillus turpanensis TaxID=2689078 RepID=UPI001407734C
MTERKAAVLVAGSWGTALASVLADNGLNVFLWSRNKEQVAEINEKRVNGRFLPETRLPEGIYATNDMQEALEGAEAVVIAATSASMREVARNASPYISQETLVIHATKGFEAETLLPMTAVLASELPQVEPGRIVVLSGPSHAEEVAARSPTTVVVAADDTGSREHAQDLFINSYFRVYTNPDVVGVEIGGALKNIIALGAGLSDGLGFGDNAKAALLTRGLAEIARLGTELGADPLTFAGLSGVGDLVVTCTSKHSRNWRAGYQLAQGQSPEEVQRSMGMVVEGIRTTKAAHLLAQKHGVEMPITRELHAVLFEGKSPRAAVEDLMGRGRTHEIEEVARTPIGPLQRKKV